MMFVVCSWFVLNTLTFSILNRLVCMEDVMNIRLLNALKLAHELTAHRHVTHDELLRFAYALLNAFDDYKKTHAH